MTEIITDTITDTVYIDELLVKYVLYERDHNLNENGRRQILKAAFSELSGYLGSDTNNQIDNMREVLKMTIPPEPVKIKWHTGISIRNIP